MWYVVCTSVHFHSELYTAPAHARTYTHPRYAAAKGKRTRRNTFKPQHQSIHPSICPDMHAIRTPIHLYTDVALLPCSCRWMKSIQTCETPGMRDRRGQRKTKKSTGREVEWEKQEGKKKEKEQEKWASRKSVYSGCIIVRCDTE